MGNYEVHCADILEWVKAYDGEPFHAILTDPPYHLTTIVKRFGKPDAAAAKYGKDGVFQRVSRGFMGQTWDGGDISFSLDTWHAIASLLYPGGFGMVYAASRNWHRVAVAIEDAGLVIYPSIFCWLNAQGLPKGTRIDTQLDDDELKKVWEGYRYGMQSLRPCVEPIIVFQRPYEGKPVSNIISTGAGALNVAAARIAPRCKNKNNGDDERQRWPANFVVSHSENCIREGDEYICHDDCAVRELDYQSGTRKGAVSTSSSPDQFENYAGGAVFGKRTWYRHRGERGYKDKGGAARYFYNSDWSYEIAERIISVDSVRLCPKVGTDEREAGLDEMPVKSYGQSGGAMSAIARGQDEYLQDHIGLNRIKQVRNDHPTLKPIKLNVWLARLLLPPVKYSPRRILVPFAGAGSEMIGAVIAGWDSVIGVEINANYCEIAKKRIEYWSQRYANQLTFDDLEVFDDSSD